MMMETVLKIAAESFWDVTFGPYTNLLGGYFWAAMLFLMAGLVWIKTQSYGATFLVLTVGGLVLSQYVGDAGILLIFAVAIGVTYVFYRLFFRRRVY